jgi:hypothetical protein
MQSLDAEERTYYNSISLKTATEDKLARSLYRLSYFLRQKFGQ